MQEENFSHNKNDASVFWDGTKAEVQKNLHVLFQDRFERMRKTGYDEAEIQEIMENMLSRERSFLTRILLQIEHARTEHGEGRELIVLFDIDETIGAGEILEDNTVRTILRPSLIPLLQTITAQGAKIGFISTRSVEAMQKQLGEAQNLAPIRQYIDKNYIYSPGRNESSISFRSYEELAAACKQKFGGAIGIIDDSRIGGEKDGDPDPDAYPDSGDLDKLAVLERARPDFEEKIIVVVDDIKYPKFLNNKNGFYGVPLQEGDEGRFFKP